MSSHPVKYSVGGVFNQSNARFDGTGMIVNGSNNRVTGESNIINGSNNKVIGNMCTVNGSNNIVEGDCCKITGSSNKVTGFACVVKGSNNTYNGHQVDNDANERWNGSSFVNNSHNSGVVFNDYGVYFTGVNANSVPCYSGQNGGAVFNGNVVIDDVVVQRNRERDPTPPKKTAPIYPEAWDKEPEEAREGKEKCVVCLTREACVIALPCAHISICVKCCRENRKPQPECVMCRVKVETYQRVFFNGAD